MSKRWVFLDLETTGLDTQKVEVLELGMVVVEAATLDVVASQSWLMWPGFADKYWEPTALNMHKASGFLRELKTKHIGRDLPSLNSVISEALDFYDDHVGDERSPMCGSTIGSFDRPIVKRVFPMLEAKFSYRCIDVSSLTELFKEWKPTVSTHASEFVGKNVHRAIPDCLASIAMLKLYREWMKL